MAFTEFCCRSGGSNLNAGTRTGSSTEPGTSADLTYASGNWVQSTGVFTVASGDPVADGVAVGDFASVYADGSTVTGFVGRVTARTTTTITVSLTAKMGTAPTDGTGNRTLKIGGAWAGPNAAVTFPFGTVQGTLTNSAADPPRVNFKNDATYSITAALSSTANDGPIFFRGYTTSYADGGLFIIDGGTSGASYVLLSLNFNKALRDCILQNNGATGSASGLSLSNNCFAERVCVNNVRGLGLVAAVPTAYFVECEAYKCNQSNTGNLGGFQVYFAIRCISHDNDAGANCHGFRDVNNSSAHHYHQCIADSNGGDGFRFITTVSSFDVNQCDAYNNTGDGIDIAVSGNIANVLIENCNLIKNGGYGINRSGSGGHSGRIRNCGFGAGTEANTSGATNVPAAIAEEGSVTYPSNSSPYVDAADGDFRITLTEAKSAGRGAFLQTQSGYGDPNPTVAYMDIGAGEHQDAAGGGGSSFIIGG